ncbi:MAG: zinc ribbon domain-containing protein [Ruminococcaceae bacterium]|nr:zinc ribbon domain-containing protein [Oscillospiraceae bacterium]
MAYCSKCGAELQTGVRFCQACGAAVAPDGSAPGQTGERFRQQAEAIFEEFRQAEDSTAAYPMGDIQKNKGMAVLGYLGLLFLIPLLAAKDSPFARFHTNQGLVIFLCSAAYEIVQKILVGVASLVFLPLGGILEVVLEILSLVFLVYVILGVVYAAKGKAKELPIVGKIHILR